MRENHREDENLIVALDYESNEYNEVTDKDYEDSDAQSYRSGELSNKHSGSESQNVPENDLEPLLADQKEDIFKIIQSYSSVGHSMVQLREQ
jgi:hypothetical protein